MPEGTQEWPASLQLLGVGKGAQARVDPQGQRLWGMARWLGGQPRPLPLTLGVGLEATCPRSPAEKAPVPPPLTFWWGGRLHQCRAGCSVPGGGGALGRSSTPRAPATARRRCGEGEEARLAPAALQARGPSGRALARGPARALRGAAHRASTRHIAARLGEEEREKQQQRRPRPRQAARARMTSVSSPSCRSGQRRKARASATLSRKGRGRPERSAPLGPAARWLQGVLRMRASAGTRAEGARLRSALPASALQGASPTAPRSKGKAPASLARRLALYGFGGWAASKGQKHPQNE